MVNIVLKDNISKKILVNFKFKNLVWRIIDKIVLL